MFPQYYVTLIHNLNYVYKLIDVYTYTLLMNKNYASAAIPVSENNMHV